MPNDDKQTDGGPADPGDRAGGQAASNDEQIDQQRRRLFWAMPSGIYLLGSMSDGVRNLMTTNWASQVASEPKLLGVSVEIHALTHRLIDEAGLFTLSLVSRDDRAVVRKFVKPAEDDRESFTLNGIAYLDAKTTKLPVLANALGYFECRITDASRFASHTFFVGEVIDVTLDRALSAGEAVEVLSMGDTRMNYGG